MIKKQTTQIPLNKWIFIQPVKFAILTFAIFAIISLLFSLTSSIFALNNTNLFALLLIIGCIYGIYWLIKRLPSKCIGQNDFISITNACALITILIPLITFMIVGRDVAIFQQKIVWLSVFYPVAFWGLAIASIILYLYILGVGVVSVYTKYKRAVSIGISKWKVICSMPFGFLLTWTPGYLIKQKQNKTDLIIKSKWYLKFSNWVVQNSANTLCVFLMFLLLRSAFAGVPNLILTGLLLVFYGLWTLKHKKDMLTNINKGYALTAVSINFMIIFVLIIGSLL